MRRIAKHIIGGIGFCAAVSVTAAAGLTSPANEQPSAATTPLVAIAASPSYVVAPSPTIAAAAAEAREQRVSRSSARAAGVARARAVTRASTLDDQAEAIAAQRATLKAKKRAAAKKAAAAKAKRKREIAKLGYTPGTKDPRDIARQILKNRYGYGASQYTCFNNIIMRESMWKVTARNSSSGAYGIPQALPGSKMASAGSDWRTNPATQITWGIEYMKDRYGSPCGAWGFKSSHGWY